MMFKLNNVIQNYAWGSRTSLSSLFGFDNPNNEPQAELWMGAHPNGCSTLQGLNLSLSDYFDLHGKNALGDYTLARYGELPYLFKVLAAHTPLSIQVHPNKRNSEIGFERENQLGIALSAGNRNYQDPNHKPELVYAITEYKAMNGFREFETIIALFDEVNIEALEDDVKSFKAAPDALGLKTLFTTLLTLAGEKQSQALAQLKANFGKPNLSDKAKQALDYSEHFCQLYPNDNGLFAPLFLNIVELQPGEAMFLHAETPHAYVQGTALEVMASSDNVLRAGLTPKHIDVEELVSNVRFEPIFESELLTKPLVREGHLHFPVPVDDFRFDVLKAKQTKQSVYVRSAEIVFCVEGEVHLASADKKITLKAGESALIPFDTTQYQYSGTGLLARVSN